MNRLKIVFFISVLCFISLSVYSRDDNSKRDFSATSKKVINDSLKADSLSNATQSTLMHQQQMQHMDSLIKIQLRKELEDAGDDKQKTEELEAKLNEIAVNDSLRKAEQLENIAQLKKNALGYPVTLRNDTLFFIYTKSGSFNSKDRASAISLRIRKLYDDPFFNPDSLRIVETEYGNDIVYNNESVILSVNNLDALWFNKESNQLAEEYLSTIRYEIEKVRGDNSLISWLKRIGMVLLIIVILSVLIISIRKLFKRLELYLHKNKEKYFNGFTIRNIKLLTPHHQLKFALRALNILRVIVIILVIYFSLPVLFSIFPNTKAYTNTLLSWVLTPAGNAMSGILDYLPNLFTIIVIYSIFRYALKGVKYFFDEIQNGNINISGFHSDWALPTFNIIKFLLYAFMIVLIFPYLPGSDSPAFQGVSVFIGVLFSLGSSNAISNMVAGLVITYMRPFKIGDRVKIGEVTGDVIEKSMLVTRIRTIKNEDITVPNANVLSSSTINYSTNTKPEDPGLIVHSTVTIGYDVPWKIMHKALIDAALRTDMIQKDPSPFVLQTSLDDFYVSYQINGYTKDAGKQAVIYSQLHQNIQDCCNEAGIEILSPHYRAERDGNTVTIPSEYLDKNYEAPAFRITQIKNDDKKNIEE
ncbi:MAG TPA: mechanosensitive ion channel family protein [Ignavibacteria bacterium]|nr:mechanosensitive ion channel family protein [Ignavibacteria bacterium]HMR39266.1 mechanosensitive ion channel family protein [Ignavibacteria bacterium]